MLLVLSVLLARLVQLALRVRKVKLVQSVPPVLLAL